MNWRVCGRESRKTTAILVGPNELAHSRSTCARSGLAEQPEPGTSCHRKSRLYTRGGKANGQRFSDAGRGVLVCPTRAGRARTSIWLGPADSHMVVMGCELSFGPVRAVLCGRGRSEGTVSRGNVCRQLQLVSPEFTQFLVDRGSTRVDYF